MSVVPRKDNATLDRSLAKYLISVNDKSRVINNKTYTAAVQVSIVKIMLRGEGRTELIAPVKTRDTAWTGAVCHRFRISDTVPVPVYPVT